MVKTRIVSIIFQSEHAFVRMRTAIHNKFKHVSTIFQSEYVATRMRT